MWKTIGWLMGILLLLVVTVISLFRISPGTAVHAYLSLTKDGRLEIAVNNGDIARVNDLLAHGANPNHRGLGSETQLMYICQNSYPYRLAMVQAFLDHGADPNLKDDDGYSELMFAIRPGNVAIVRLMLSHGASVKDVAGGKSVLEMALATKDDEIIRAIQEKVNETGGAPARPDIKLRAGSQALDVSVQK
jgi:ankyrin repeat protein